MSASPGVTMSWLPYFGGELDSKRKPNYKGWVPLLKKGHVRGVIECVDENMRASLEKIKMLQEPEYDFKMCFRYNQKTPADSILYLRKELSKEFCDQIINYSYDLMQRKHVRKDALLFIVSYTHVEKQETPTGHEKNGIEARKAIIEQLFHARWREYTEGQEYPLLKEIGDELWKWQHSTPKPSDTHDAEIQTVFILGREAEERAACIRGLHDWETRTIQRSGAAASEFKEPPYLEIPVQCTLCPVEELRIRVVSIYEINLLHRFLPSEKNLLIIVMFKFNERESFNYAYACIKSLKETGLDRLKLYLVGNKQPDQEKQPADKQNSPNGSTDLEVTELVDSGVVYAEICLSDGTNVDTFFLQIIEELQVAMSKRSIIPKKEEWF